MDFGEGNGVWDSTETVILDLNGNEFFDSPLKQMEGSYTLGNRESVWTFWFFNGMKKEESNYYAITSEFPIGYNGMLATLRASKMEYKLSAPFDSTLPSGYSTETNLTLNQPLIESPDFNLKTSLSLGNNKYVNDLGTGNNSDKDVWKSIFNLGFDSRDDKLGGGINYGSFGLTLARIDLTDNTSNW